MHQQKEKKYYITTPIYYVNSTPHLGHAYTSIACDVMARFKRLDGYNVYFLTGTDEHGEKVQRSAHKAGMDEQSFVDSLFPAFQNTLRVMNCSNSDFIRTTEKRHADYVKQVWKTMVNNDDIYLGKYAGWYSIRDEAFFSEDEIIDGRSPTGAEVSWIEEESYFFRLSKWQEKLLQLYEAQPDFISPKSRYKETVSFVTNGLHDLSISRTSITWGIPVPGSSKHVMYVWIDALFNYLSALQTDDLYKTFWPCDLHVVGKEILRFHAVYWPAFLMAMGIELPRKIFAHGWLVAGDGQKMSKSIGNVVDPVALCEKVGCDTLRYFFMRNVPFGNDGRYCEKNLILRVNAELVNSIGNLTQRVLSFIYKNLNQQIPTPSTFFEEDRILLNKTYTAIDRIRLAFDQQEIHVGLEVIYQLSNDANVYIDRQAPWNLSKYDMERTQTVLYTLAEVVRIISILLQPFVPTSANRLLQIMGLLEPDIDATSHVLFLNCDEASRLCPGHKICEPTIVFPRLKLD